MKLLAVTILGLCLMPSISLGSFGDAPKETLEMKDGKKCYRYAENIIYIDRQEDGDHTPTISIGYSKVTKNFVLKTACDNAKQNLVLKNINNSTFLGISGSLVFLTEYKRAPGTGKIEIFSVETGRKKISIFTNGEPVRLLNGKLIYFSHKKYIPSKEDNLTEWTKYGCQDRWADNGLGCTQIVKSILNLKNFKIAETKESKVEPAQ